MAKKIIISRTDNIGDVILTLPMAGILKKAQPDIKIAFLGKSYTQPIVAKSQYADEFYDWEEIKTEGLSGIGADAIIHVLPNKEVAQAAKLAAIKLRIGTSHRVFHWLSCNKLVNLGRKNSDLHEAQLNLKLLEPLGIKGTNPLSELSECYGWKNNIDGIEKGKQYLDSKKFNIIFHMKSKGSAREWGTQNFLALARSLPVKHFNILISGTEDEGILIKKECPEIFDQPHVMDITGKFSLSEFIDFIQSTDGLLACSTGPLHIAAASGIYTLGLYPSQRPMHPGRWAPIGKNTNVLTEKGELGEYLNISMTDVEHSIINNIK